MSENGWTPGPWLVEQHDFGDGDGLQWTVVRTGKWPLLAVVYGVDDENDERAEADARLIAAAPEAVELLQEWLATDGYGMDWDDFETRVESLLNRISDKP